MKNEKAKVAAVIGLSLLAIIACWTFIVPIMCIEAIQEILDD
jgi:hypothetical protein